LRLKIDEGDTIHHDPSRSHFEIFRMSDQAGLRAIARLGDDPPILDLHGANFDGIIDNVRSWALAIPRWMEIPDLWKSIPDHAVVPGELIRESANTPFTPDEQATISAQLNEIREAVKKTYELTAEQSTHVDEKFEEAEKASRRMGRKDWGLLFGGALLSLILSDTITPAIMGDILMMVQHGIGHMFLGGPPSVRSILSAGQD
jgi:hypothetical protein